MMMITKKMITKMTMTKMTMTKITTMKDGGAEVHRLRLMIDNEDEFLR